jgi:hypothetical protein
VTMARSPAPSRTEAGVDPDDDLVRANAQGLVQQRAAIA